jgi:hypothetical protein
LPNLDGAVEGNEQQAPDHASLQRREVDYALDACSRPDSLLRAAVISGPVAEECFRDYVAEYAASPYIKGVRQVLHNPETPRGYWLAERFVRGVRMLVGHSRPVSAGVGILSGQDVRGLQNVDNQFPNVETSVKVDKR